MILKIADAVVENAAVTFSELSYGKRNRSSFIPFEIYGNDSEKYQKFDCVYRDLISELKKDDAQVGEFQPPYEGALCYPSIDEVMSLTREMRMEFFSQFLIFDILKLFFNEEDCRDAVEGEVSEVEGFALENECLVLRGFVPSIGIPAA